LSAYPVPAGITSLQEALKQAGIESKIIKDPNYGSGLEQIIEKEPTGYMIFRAFMNQYPLPGLFDVFDPANVRYHQLTQSEVIEMFKDLHAMVPRAAHEQNRKIPREPERALSANEAYSVNVYHKNTREFICTLKRKPLRETPFGNWGAVQYSIAGEKVWSVGGLEVYLDSRLIKKLMTQKKVCKKATEGLPAGLGRGWFKHSHDHSVAARCGRLSGSEGGYELPTFKGWTVDERLSQFRKVHKNAQGRPTRIEYLDFNDPKAAKLYGAYLASKLGAAVGEKLAQYIKQNQGGNSR